MDPRPSLSEEAETKAAQIDDKVADMRAKLQDQAAAANKAIENAIASLNNASDEATEEEKRARQVSEDFNNAIKKAIETLDFVQSAATESEQGPCINHDGLQEFTESNPVTPPPDDALSPLDLVGDESPILTQELSFAEECITPKNGGKVKHESERKKGRDKATLSNVTLAPAKTIEK
jgi:hypothetical protein